MRTLRNISSLFSNRCISSVIMKTVHGHNTKARYMCRIPILIPKSNLKSEQVRQLSYEDLSEFHCRVDSAELISYGNDLLREIATTQLGEEDMELIRYTFTSMLHQLYIRKDLNLIPFFEKVSSHNVLTEDAYNIMMKHYVDEKDVGKIKDTVELLKADECVPTSSRSFVPPIIALLRNGSIEECRWYLKEMVKFMGPDFIKDSNFHDILNVCTEVRTYDNQDTVEQFVEEIFAVFEKFGSFGFDKKLVDAICGWFNSDLKRQWSISKTYISRNDIGCSFCGEVPAKRVISSDRFTRLGKNMVISFQDAVIRKDTSIVDNDLESTISNGISNLPFYERLRVETVNKQSSRIRGDIDDLQTEFSTAWTLNEYLDKHPKFDIVIDLLNLGYSSNHGFDPVHVKDIIDVFIKKKRRILIFCAGRVRKEILSEKAAAPGMRHIKHLVVYLNRHCQLCFIPSSIIDDYYMLYTAIHYNFDVKLVSSDLFRDHLHDLDAQNIVDFQRWQKRSQYVINPNNGKHIFEPLTLDFDLAMQKGADGGWHVPVGRGVGRSWYCISKT